MQWLFTAQSLSLSIERPLHMAALICTKKVSFMPGTCTMTDGIIVSEGSKAHDYFRGQISFGKLAEN